MTTTEKQDAITDHEDQDPQMTHVALAVDALPFTQVNTDNADQLLRQWLIREVIQPDTPMAKSTILFLEDLFQWTKTGMPDPKVRMVK